MSEGEGDFSDFFLGIGEGFIYDGGVPVGVEEHGVQDVDGDEGGDAELADFEDGVAGVHGFKEFPLRPVHVEADAFAVFVEDPIEVVEASFPVFEEGVDVGFCFRCEQVVHRVVL